VVDRARLGLFECQTIEPRHGGDVRRRPAKDASRSTINLVVFTPSSERALQGRSQQVCEVHFGGAANSISARRVFVAVVPAIDPGTPESMVETRAPPSRFDSYSHRSAAFKAFRCRRQPSVNAGRLIRPISARFYLGASLRSSAAILVRRLATRSSTCKESLVESDRVRRNISRTC